MKYLIVTVFLGMVAVTAIAQTVPPNDGYLTDTVHLFSSEEERQYEKTLRSYAQLMGTPVLVVTLRDQVIPNLRSAWQLSEEATLLMFLYERRELYIEPPVGSEVDFSEAVTTGIFKRDVLPHWRNGQYAKAIQDGVSAVQQHLEGEYTASRYRGLAGSAGGTVRSTLIITVLTILLGWLAHLVVGSYFKSGRRLYLGAVAGWTVGVVLVVTMDWWLSIPYLTVVGLLLDRYLHRRLPARRTVGYRYRSRY